MKKILFIPFFCVLFVFGATSQVLSATIAEASTGYQKSVAAKYDLSEMTEDEREWFLTFFEGNFFADGWMEISSEIISSTLSHERDEQQKRLDDLGFKIGREWCKGNETRKIHTSMLKKWGRVLRETAAGEPHLLTEVIERINQEVDALLN